MENNWKTIRSKEAVVIHNAANQRRMDYCISIGVSVLMHNDILYQFKSNCAKRLYGGN